MGEDAATTLKEISAARDALERDLSELQERMPPKSQMIRTAVVGGGGLAGVSALLAILAKVMSGRSERKAVEKEAAIQARAIAAAFAAHAPQVAAAQHRAAADLAASDLVAARESDEDDTSFGMIALLIAVVSGLAAGIVWLRQRGTPEDEDLWLDEPEQDVVTPAG